MGTLRRGCRSRSAGPQGGWTMPAETVSAHEIEQLVIAIGEVQTELADPYGAKPQAVRAANSTELDRLTRREERLATKLKAHLRERHQILQRAAAQLGPQDSLEAIVRGFAEPQRGRLLARITETRTLVEANRRESWVLWIVSKQSLRLFGNMLELIANGGRKPPVYSTGAGREAAFGGA